MSKEPDDNDDLRVRKHRSKEGRRSIVDVSREIVIDTMVLTTNLLHSIRNNLPIELEGAQQTEHRPREPDAPRGWASGARGLLLALMVALLVLGGLSWLGMRLAEPVDDLDEPTEAAAVAEVAPVAAEEPAPVDRLEQARGLLDVGDAETAVELLEAELEEDERLEVWRSYVEALLAAERPADARSSALLGLQAHPRDPALIEAFHAGAEADPALAPRPAELHADEVESIWAVGRSPLTLRVNTADGHAAELLLDQPDSPRAWRNEIASYRFCQILACPFQMRPVRAVTVERGELEAILDKRSTPHAWAPRPDLDRLSWQKDGDRQFVHATLVEHVAEGEEDVDEGAPWPIEHPRLWRNWLSADLDPAYLDEPFEVAHGPVSELPHLDADRLMKQRFVDEGGEATTRDVARALAGVMIFDFLTNNWSRFSKEEADFGARLRLRAGHLLSLDHEETFRYRASKRVRGRFEWVTRMPRQMTTAIQHLDLERVTPLLFPEPDRVDRARMQIVTDQQLAFVERVAGLALTHGDEAVFALE